MKPRYSQNTSRPRVYLYANLSGRGRNTEGEASEETVCQQTRPRSHLAARTAPVALECYVISVQYTPLTRCYDFSKQLHFVVGLIMYH